MLNAIFRPLEKWPGPQTPSIERRLTPFSAAITDTLDLLERELAHLYATNVVIEAQVDRTQIRNDGWLKSDARVAGPAVILNFRGSDGEDYRYPCDTFTHWHANLRAIALSLEALRKIDRYGVTARGEQYQGFRALPPPGEQVRQMQPLEAAGFIASKIPGVDTSALVADRQLFDTIFKLAQRKLHPDANGSHDDFVKLQEAGAALIEWFKKQSEKAAGGAR